MNAQQFTAKVLENFKKHFPNGYANASKFSLGGGVYFSFGLIGNIEDVENKIRQNDNLSLSLEIHENFKFDTTEEIEGKIVIESNRSFFSVKPVNNYFAMSSVKIPFRKINNTPEKALISIEKHFIKAKELIKAEIEIENLYGQHSIDKKYLDL